MPCVSIIVPVYKVERFLRRCLDSLLNQTYQDLEVIMVDDGSPDQCPVICDEYAKKHPNFFVIHKENGGLSSARQAGFEQAKGTYVLFVDSDDYIDSRMVEELQKAIEKENAELSMCGYYTEKTGMPSLVHKLPYKSPFIEGPQILNQYIYPLLLPLPSDLRVPGFVGIRMYRRNLIQPAYFVHEARVFVEDHVFNLLYSDHIKRIAVVNQPLYHYCFAPQSLSNRYRKDKQGMDQRALDFYLSFAQQRGINISRSRIEHFAIHAVYGAVNNAAASGCYRIFKTELNNLRTSSLYRKARLSSLVSKATKPQRFCFQLLRLKWDMLLYIARIIRLKLASY